MNIDPLDFSSPHAHLPEERFTDQDIRLAQLLHDVLRGDSLALSDVQEAFDASSFPKNYQRLIMILYAAGERRILVTRSGQTGELLFADVFQRLLMHPRRQSLTQRAFRLQVDYVIDSPQPVDLQKIGMSQPGDKHFEIGIDGLIFKTTEGKLHIFTPGDAYVRSVMGMVQLRDYLRKSYGPETIRTAKFERFRSISYVTTLSNTWRRLYRGHPIIGKLNAEKIKHALNIAIEHIQRTQKPDGTFLYYYDAAKDSYLDHEHPTRDPIKNPYYNILRHAGGALTCLFMEQYCKINSTWNNIRSAINYLISQSRTEIYNNKPGTYIYSEKKAKLGGSGIALYLIARYERATGDKTFRKWADQIAWHLIHQITSTGEFIYYNIYLDKRISESENFKYFSFFYPGEAICGLAAYLHLLPKPERTLFFEKIQKALEFLLIIRPKTRASEYSNVPSDGWLMMGIMEAWDFKEMQNPLYSDFVFSDAQKMIDHMYKVTDAPYPDYAGGFYYTFGDYPYVDGARCEGLLGAYELAVKMGDHKKAKELWCVLKLVSWALLHLVNTEDSIYSVPKPEIALGGIRFKYTRQWFRIDTIQHVASFFAKLLPYWDQNELDLNDLTEIDRKVLS